MSLQLRIDLPEHHGLSSKALLDFYTQMERQQLEVNSFMLLQNGKVTSQFWRQPYHKDAQQLLFSLSKSFTSIAVGIAWDNGFLDLKDPVIAYFPDQLPDKISNNLAQMTLHHLLSMNTGHHHNIYGSVAKEQDWVRAFLSQDVEFVPGSHYRYSTHATYMLSAIVEKATGLGLVDFLMPRLFQPLGIPRPTWETCPMGTVAGGMGLSIATDGIAKFGQMLLNKGEYEGQRIVSEEYVNLAISEQSDNREGEQRIDSAQGYGYQFFLCRRGCFMGNGAFGQLCFVAPEHNIVIAATSSFPSMKELQTLLDFIYSYIIDSLGDDSPPVLSREYSNELHQLLATKSYPVPAFQPIPDNITFLVNHYYVLDDNPHHLNGICFNISDNELEVQFQYRAGEEKRLSFDFTKEVVSEDLFIKDLSLHHQQVVTYATWKDPATLILTLHYVETPYLVTYTVIFSEPNMELQFHMNVSLGISDYKVMGKHWVDPT